MRETRAAQNGEGASIAHTPTVIYAEFYLTGVVTVLLGPILPALRTHFGVSPAQAGTLFVAQFAASSVGALFSQVRVAFSIAFGLLLMTLGVAALPFSSWGQTHVAVALFGLGLGLAIPATNMYVSGARGRQRASSLNIINFVWGIGAATAPMAIGSLTRQTGLRTSLLIIAAANASVFTLLLISPLRKPESHVESGRLVTPSAELLPLLIFCAMLFLYVGAETAIGGWTAAYVREIGGGTSFGELALFCFWMALLSGRAAAPYTLRLIQEPLLYRVSLVIAALGIASLIVSRTAASATVSAFVVGAGFAPVFALTVATISRHAESRRTRVPGWVFSIGGFGGAVLPWLVGTAATRLRSLRYGLLVVIAAVLALLVLHLWQQWTLPFYGADEMKPGCYNG